MQLQDVPLNNSYLISKLIMQSYILVLLCYTLKYTFNNFTCVGNLYCCPLFQPDIIHFWLIKSISTMCRTIGIPRSLVYYKRKIIQIIDKYRLVSDYTIKVENLVNREFDNRSDLEIVVSDLTYVNAAGKS